MTVVLPSQVAGSADLTVEARLIEMANHLRREKIILGGPLKYFIDVGRSQLTCLLENGLMPDAKVLDIGCGGRAPSAFVSLRLRFLLSVRGLVTFRIYLRGLRRV